MSARAPSETWKKMVLRSMPSPGWLAPDAPDGDVVVSSRARFARNVVGFPFPHCCDADTLRRIEDAVVAACRTAPVAMDATRRLTEAERDFMLGSRLISPEFEHREPGRALVLDQSRTLSVMVNEEDHLRVQALTAGWSIATAHDQAAALLAHLARHLEFMHHPAHGFLTASPMNAGEGRRWSALFHLIGLAHTRRLADVLKALDTGGITARGLYGESSRAVGAFFQVSAIGGAPAEFQGAGEYLIAEERRARRDVPRREIEEKFDAAVEFAVASAELGLADALRVLAWARWAAVATLPGAPAGAREVDQWVAVMEVHGTQDARTASRHRATFVRERLERPLGATPE
jgi:protein arginine kinase